MTDTEITSPHNARLKQLRTLARARGRAATGLFAAEGEDLVCAAHAAGREPLYGFCSTPLGLPGFQQLAPELLASVSALGSGTRAIGVYEQRLDERPQGPLCLYLHGVGDPGNVGTALRSALAFGASSVALGPDCADPHSPKAVRASMGAIFAVAVCRVSDVAELPGERVALAAGGGEPLWRVLAGPADRSESRAAAVRATGLTLLVGAERAGLPGELLDACERVAHIPIAGDSLNAAMAATVALYEVRRASQPSGDGPDSSACGRPRHPLGRVPRS